MQALRWVAMVLYFAGCRHSEYALYGARILLINKLSKGHRAFWFLSIYMYLLAYYYHI
jgi:hypothetical protein